MGYLGWNLDSDRVKSLGVNAILAALLFAASASARLRQTLWLDLSGECLEAASEDYNDSGAKTVRLLLGEKPALPVALATPQRDASGIQMIDHIASKPVDLPILL